VSFCAGFIPETDESGKEKWPKGEEKVWRAGMRSVDKSEYAVPSVVEAGLPLIT
jgi:hypothetical protein